MQTTQLGPRGAGPGWWVLVTIPRTEYLQGERIPLQPSAPGPHPAPRAASRFKQSVPKSRTASIMCLPAASQPLQGPLPQLADHPAFRPHCLSQGKSPQPCWVDPQTPGLQLQRQRGWAGTEVSPPTLCHCPGYCGNWGSSTPPSKDMQGKQFPHPVLGSHQVSP